MSISIWQLQDRPDRLEADALVVGAGVVGLVAALELVAQGADVVIVERATPGHGASARNAGYLMRGAADDYATCVRALGRDAARTLWRATERNHEILRALGAADVEGYTTMPSCLLAATDDEHADLVHSAELLRADGFELDITESGTDLVWRNGRYRLGLINPHDAVCHPGKLLARLAEHLNGSGSARLCTNEPVATIEHQRGAWHTRTRTLTIESRCVVVCTNAGTPPLLPTLEGVIEPNRGQMVAFDGSTLPPEDRPAMAYYADRGGDYFRAQGDVLLVGGRRRSDEAAERTTCTQTSATVQHELNRLAASLFGRTLPVLRRWAGTMAFTPDGLPIAGPIPAHGGEVWACAGFNGHGMSLGAVTATAAARAVLGRARDEDLALLGLFSPGRAALQTL